MTENNSLLEALLSTGKPVAGGDQPPATPNPNEPTPLATPPAEPPAPPAEPITTLPLELFGEEFKEKTIDDVVAEFKTARQKAMELESQIQEVSKKTLEYGSPTVQAFDAWVKNGGVDDFKVFSMVKSFTPEMDNVDALVAKQVLENPQFLGHEKVIKQQIISNYQIEADEVNGLTPEQVEFNKAKLTADAEKAKNYLKEQQAKLQVQQSAPVNTEEILAKRKSDWSVAAANTVSTLKAIPIPGAVKNGEKYDYPEVASYALPETIVNKYKDEFVDLFAKSIDATPETVKQFQGQLYQRMIVENLPYIVQTALDKQKAQLEEEFDKKYNGGVVKQPGGGSIPGAHAKTSGDAHLQNLLGG